jgi:wyosine [tRNA(Phe)-imidazoG37] synthetase (radical SAM superfamily)
MKIIKQLVLKYFYMFYPNRKLFCPIPFKYMEIGTNSTSLCCYLYKSPGILKGSNLLELYNSPSAQEARKSILDGSFKYCDLDACPHFSSGDLPLQADCAGTPYEKIILNKNIVLEKMSIWIAFDPRCNLRCFSCRKEHFNPTEEQRCEIERKMEIVKNNLSNLKHIGLTGNGDPFASPTVRKFLYELNVSDYPELRITILTNGLLFNETSWNSMEKCRSAIKSVQVSVDAATKESYERIRIGGSFEKLMENLNFLKKLRECNQINEFIISFVVNAINFTEMKAFVELGVDLGCDQIYFSHMGNWGTFTNAEYDNFAVHLPKHKLHSEFRKTLENPIFNHPIVFLGSIKRFQKRRVLRDSLFS